MTRYIEQTNLFKRQVKLAQKRGKDIDKLKIAIQHLSQDKLLAIEYRDHKLIGNFGGCRECHIEPDWLMIYRLTNDGGLELIETGTHSDLFN